LRILVTGHNAYQGSVLVPLFHQAITTQGGSTATLFPLRTFGSAGSDVEAIQNDVRDIETRTYQVDDEDILGRSSPLSSNPPHALSSAGAPRYRLAPGQLFTV